MASCPPSEFWSPDLYVVHIIISECIIVVKITGRGLHRLLPSSGLYQLCGIGEPNHVVPQFPNVQNEDKNSTYLLLFCRT